MKHSHEKTCERCISVSHDRVQKPTDVLWPTTYGGSSAKAKGNVGKRHECPVREIVATSDAFSYTCHVNR